MDFSKMNGYEFEDYIADLLTSLGFSVSKTPYSGDGGIDLIAERTDPFFSGKYLIQCKNWTGSVGQPEVRDLFGVVTSERANKGILVATSDFTVQAYEFAKDKNLELIDGEALQSIIDNSSIKSKQDCFINDKLGENNFNEERYDYLKKSIKSNPKERLIYSSIINFLFGYFFDYELSDSVRNNIPSKIVEICTYGLAKNKKKDYYGKNDKSWITRDICISALVSANIILGELGKATNLLLEENLFFIKRWTPIRNRDKIHEVKEMLARNLYSAYKQIQFDVGCKIMVHEEIEVLKSRNFIPYDTSEIDSATKDKDLFLSGFYSDSFFEIDGFNGFIFTKKKKKMSDVKQHFFKKTDEEIKKEILHIFMQHDVQII